VDSVVDAQGNVWVALSGAGQIARFAPETQEWKLFKIPTENSGPGGVICDSKGFVWFTENGAGKIGRLDPKSSFVAEFSAPTAKDPRAIVIGSDGALWFTARDSNLIGRVDLGSGKISEFSVPTQNAHPDEIVSGGDGGLWFAELSGQKLGRVEPGTGQISEFAPQDTEIHPRGLVSVPGAIYFTDYGGGRLGRFTIADGKFHVWESPDGVDSQPVGIAVDSTGKIWYEESAEKTNKLVRVDPATLDFNVFPMPLKNASVDKIARDAKGRLWMALSRANKILVVE
jgi:virginiamycin B lyase